MTRVNPYCALLAAAALLLPFPAPAQDGRLAKAWETSAEFLQPESVAYDAERNVLYVSNINGSPTEKNGAGFISRLNADGSIEELEWVGELHAPKGLAIHGGRLYAADIDALVEIDIAAGVVTNRYEAPGAVFLNDVAAAANGDIYVSDMMTDSIHRLRDGEFSRWLQNPELEAPNGVLVDGDRLIVGSWGRMSEGFATETPGHLKAVSLADKTITSLGSGAPIGNLDGVEPDGRGNFYVTDWMAGKLFHIGADGSVRLLLELEQGLADHAYVPAHDTLYLPLMQSGRVLAYKLNSGE